MAYFDSNGVQIYFEELKKGSGRDGARLCVARRAYHAGGGLMSDHSRRISSIWVSTAHSVSAAALSGIARKIEPALESP